MTLVDDVSLKFMCPRCENRVNSGGAAVGTKTKCPTCGLELIVPRRSKVDARAGQGGAEDDQYALRPEAASSVAEIAYIPGRDYRDARAIAEKKAEVEEREESIWQAVRHTPPLGLFFAGTFSFPFLPTAQVQSLTLAGGLMAALTPITIGAWCANAGDGGYSGAGMIIGGLMLIATGLGLLAMWLVTASVYGLAILRETSYGCQTIERWPIGFSIDAMGESIYLFSGVVFSVLPGLIAAPLWDWLGWPKALATSILTVLLFPPMLLSMLEGSSPMKAISLPVWRSVLVAWQAWALFYMITFVAFACLVGFLAVIEQWGPFFQTILCGLLFPAAWMIYFRLLGRLAWFCSGRSNNCRQRCRASG